MNIFVKLAVIVSMGTVSMAGWADERRPPPEIFSQFGEVSEIDYENRIIVVNDGWFRVSNKLVVQSRFNLRDSFSSVRPGDIIGFNTINAAVGDAKIEEIKILRDNRRIIRKK